MEVGIHEGVSGTVSGDDDVVGSCRGSGARWTGIRGEKRRRRNNNIPDFP